MEKQKEGMKTIRERPSQMTTEHKPAMTKGKDLYSDHIVRKLPINIVYHAK